MSNYTFASRAQRVLSLSFVAHVDHVEVKLFNRASFDNPIPATDGNPKRLRDPFRFSFEVGKSPEFGLLCAEVSGWTKHYRTPTVWLLGCHDAFPRDLNEIYYEPTIGSSDGLVDRAISFTFDPTKQRPELAWADDLGGEGVFRLLPGQAGLLMTLRIPPGSSGKLSLQEGHPWGIGSRIEQS